MIEGLGFAMALQFKPDGKGGWLYRKDQTGAPIPATQEERDRFVRRFGWIVLSSLPLFMGLIIIFSIVMTSQVPESASNNVKALWAIVMGGGSMALTYLYVKWFSHAPARAYSNRAPVGPAQTRKQVFGRQLAKGSYTKLAATMVLVAIAGVWALRDNPESWWLPIGLPLVIGLAVAYWRRSIEREPG